MLGFSAISEAAISDLAVSGPNVTVNPPSDGVTITITAPKQSAGASNKPPSDTIAISTFVPVVRAGASAHVAADAVAITLTAPKVSSGVNIGLAGLTRQVSITTTAPNADSGVEILASGAFSVIHAASISETAISETEIDGGNGETVYSPRVVPRVIFIPMAPTVVAGKSVHPPATTFLLTSARAEIDSRRRKLRVLAIAS